MLDFDKKICTGCTACYASCPYDAIKMIQSDEGFYIPSISIEKCKECGLCEKVCPVMNPSQASRSLSHIRQCYAAYAIDKASRKSSTSGGVFYELAKYVISEGGVICGCVWDKDFVAKHICTDDLCVVERMRGSKYVQSDLGNCFKEIKEISKSRTVLFCGVPCQVTALKRYMPKSDNIICVSLICGGCPSPEVWRLYKEFLEDKYNSKLSFVNHRSKKKGWLVLNMQLAFENGKSVNEALVQNIYSSNFFSGLTILDSCFDCSFKLDSMDADLVIGDHWGIDKKMLNSSKNKGCSVVIPLTEKGNKIFDDIKKFFQVEPESLDKILSSSPHLMKKHKENANRQRFFRELHTTNIAESLQAGRDKIRHDKLRNFLLKIGIYAPLYKLIWKIRHK